MSHQSADPLTIPDPRVDPELSLLDGPVDVSLEIQIPALDIIAPILSVGLGAANTMDVPINMAPSDSMWQTVFWYRGSRIPGDIGTATLAGHVTDLIGQPGVFANLDDLQIGDLIVVQDKRTGLSVPFIVTETETYTRQEAADPAVNARIFGSISDVESHLTLITCTGAWVDGSFDRHLVVYATRASYPLRLIDPYVSSR